MDAQEFSERVKQVVDFIDNYYKNLSALPVVPTIKPGYLRQLLPTSAPEAPESFDDIMKDIEKHIMPGMAHWQHPRFHAYFPNGVSYPSLIAAFLCDSFGVVGFSWESCPVMTELETIMMDWLGKAIGLPDHFITMSQKPNPGGGVLQCSASECILVAMLAARHHKIRKMQEKDKKMSRYDCLAKLVMYCSKQAHSSVEKDALISFVTIRILDTDDRYRMRGELLKKTMEQDISDGLVPFFVSCILGSTSCVSFDVLEEIGPICKEHEVWMHCDAAYAGGSFICPELREPMKGLEYADSFNMNANKFFLTHFDCSCLWVKDRNKLKAALTVDPVYLKKTYSEADDSSASASIDYRHWQIQLSRRMRSLKLWFVMRMYGVEGLQKFIRSHVKLAKRFEELVKADDRFEVVGDVLLGNVCFRVKDKDNKITETLLTNINMSRKLHMIPSVLKKKYVIRFCLVRENADEKDVDDGWKVIQDAYEAMLVDGEPVAKCDYMQQSHLVRMVSDAAFEVSRIKTCVHSCEPAQHDREQECDVTEREEKPAQAEEGAEPGKQ